MPNSSEFPIQEEISSEAFRRKTPLSLTLEIGWDCNLRCIHCFHDGRSHPGLETEEIKKLLDTVAELGGFSLSLTGGEPTLRQDLVDVVEHAREHGFLVSLASNGQLLEDTLVEEFARLGVFSVGVAIYSADPEVHDSITRVRGSFRRAINSLRALQRHKIKTFANCLVMRENLHAWEGVPALAAEVGAEPVCEPFLFQKRGIHGEPPTSRLEYAELVDFYAKKVDKPEGQKRRSATGEILPPRSVGESVPCHAGHTSVAVTADGDVVPCPFYYRVAGNIRTQDFREIWFNSPVMAEVRSVTVGQSRECMRCDLRTTCVRCPGVALQEHGDASGFSSFACNRARAREEVLRSSSSNLAKTPSGPGPA